MPRRPLYRRAAAASPLGRKRTVVTDNFLKKKLEEERALSAAVGESELETLSDELIRR